MQCAVQAIKLHGLQRKAGTALTTLLQVSVDEVVQLIAGEHFRLLLMAIDLGHGGLNATRPVHNCLATLVLRPSAATLCKALCWVAPIFMLPHLAASWLRPALVLAVPALWRFWDLSALVSTP